MNDIYRIIKEFDIRSLIFISDAKYLLLQIC
jgi:hypothetical protein